MGHFSNQESLCGQVFVRNRKDILQQSLGMGLPDGTDSMNSVRRIPLPHGQRSARRSTKSETRARAQGLGWDTWVILALILCWVLKGHQKGNCHFWGPPKKAGTVCSHEMCSSTSSFTQGTRTNWFGSGFEWGPGSCRVKWEPCPNHRASNHPFGGS